MATRALPDLRSRIRIDSSDIEKTEAKARDLDRTLRATGDSTRPLAQGLTGLGNSRGVLGDVGANLTRNVTLPLAAGAAGALVLSDRFNTTFAQMQGLAGVTAGEVDGLRDSVLSLAHDAGLAPQLVAEGLYQIRSSGLEGQVALDALDRSARASALGLGEVDVVADALTSAINAYGSENLSAAQATDILVAAVREGKGEADQMAGTLGRVLPVAAELGVGFDEVAGSIAFLSRSNGDAAQSTTQLSGILQKLIRPSQQAREVLADVGLSTDELRRVVREDGLLAALQLLDERLGGNSEMLGKVFEDSEGLVGVLGLLRNGGTEAAGVIDSVTSSVGELNQRIAKLQETDELKARQALADLQAAGIEAGAELAPILADIAGGVGNVAEKFATLPDGVQKVVIGLGGIAIAAGPTMSAIDGLRRGYDLLSSSGGRVSSAITGVASKVGISAGALGAGALAVTGLAIAWAIFEQRAAEARAEAERVDAAIDDLVANAVDGGRDLDVLFRERLARSLADLDGGLERVSGTLNAALTATGTSVDELLRIISAGNGEVTGEVVALAAELEGAVEGAGTEVYNLQDAWRSAETQATEYHNRQSELGVGLEHTGEKAAGTTSDFEDLTGAQEDSAAATQEQVDAWKAAEDQLNRLTDAVLGSFDAQVAYERAQDDIAEAIAARADAETRLANPADDEERARAADDLTRAEDQLLDAVLRQADAAVERNALQAEANGHLYTAAQRNADYREELFLLATQLSPEDPLRQRIVGLIGELGEVDQRHAAEVDVDGVEGARQELHGFDIYLNDVTRRRTAYVDVVVNIPNDGSYSGDWKDYVRYARPRRLGSIDEYSRGGIRSYGEVTGLPRSGLPGRLPNIDEYARGGIRAHVGRGDLIRYAEPETGGEAYIPRLGDRQRSIDILSTVAREWFGLNVVPMARGGVTLPSPLIPDAARLMAPSIDVSGVHEAVASGVDAGMRRARFIADTPAVDRTPPQVTIVTQSKDVEGILAAQRRTLAMAGF